MKEICMSASLLLSAENLVPAFAEYLKESPNLPFIASFHNSFENWLKFEFCALLSKPPHNLVPQKTIGVEYSAKLKGLDPHSPHKRVDIWTSAPADRWNFIEMKVVFSDSNSGKQIHSWLSDYNILANEVDENFERLNCVVSVLFGVGYERQNFEKAVKTMIHDDVSGEPSFNTILCDVSVCFLSKNFHVE